MNPGLTCKHLIDFLDDYVAGAQPPDVRATFELHLDACRHCREYLESYARAVRLGKEALADERLVREMPESLVKAILDSTKDPG